MRKWVKALDSKKLFWGKCQGKGKGNQYWSNYIILINYLSSLNIWFRSHFPSLFFSMTSVIIMLALSASAHSDTQTSVRLCKTLTSFSLCKCPALFQGRNRPADAKLLCLFQETHCFNKQLSCLAILLLVSGCQSVSKNWWWWEDETSYSLTELHCSSAQL